MSIEQAKVGEVAARMMERLEREYQNDGSAQVCSVFLISAVRHDDGERLTVHYDTSSGVTPYEALELLSYEKKEQLVSLRETVCSEGFNDKRGWRRMMALWGSTNSPFCR